ncbi:MAG: FAD:protein FMN transferase [Cyclobacteriaceae bacterium]|nr:FAD:protein FMN transferase [Cyclobacteriaceae bacterium]
MSHKKTLRIFLPIFLGVFFCLNDGYGQRFQRFEYSQPAMGTVLNIIMYASDSTTAKKAASEAFDRVQHLNQIFSDYIPNSELNRLCQKSGEKTPVQISDELFEVLLQANSISKQTKGSFDITIGAYSKIWRQAKKTDEFPSKKQLKIAKKTTGYKRLLLNKNNKTAVLKRKGMQLDLGGIAKGYTADAILLIFKQHGIKQALVDFGGDIATSNPPPNQAGWNIEVSYTDHTGKKISDIVSLSNSAIATSGNLYQKVIIDGKTYSHIINPFTGLGLTKNIQTTVIAPSATLADGFASSFSIMNKEEIKKLLLQKKEVHAFSVETKGNSTDLWHSAYFN